METFFNLIQEVQKPGLCHRCGGCVTFCTAVNFGALELDSDGKPRYSDIEKCIECGLCYSICPEIDRFLHAPHQGSPDEPLENMRCILEQGMLCMGPVTKAGCGGDGIVPRCISARVPCRGCYGPVQKSGNQRLDMLNALASNGIDIASLPETTSLLRFSGAHHLLRPARK